MAPHSSTLAWRIPGTGSLVGCCLWGRTESDMTETTQQQQQQQQQQEFNLEVQTLFQLMTLFPSCLPSFIILFSYNRNEYNQLLQQNLNYFYYLYLFILIISIIYVFYFTILNTSVWKLVACSGHAAYKWQNTSQPRVKNFKIPCSKLFSVSDSSAKTQIQNYILKDLISSHHLISCLRR